MIDNRTITLEAEDRTMATAQLVSLEEYLRTSYRPDCDYIEGELRERNVGQHDHSRLQFLILLALGRKEEEWQIHTLPEQRLRVQQRRYPYFGCPCPGCRCAADAGDRNCSAALH